MWEVEYLYWEFELDLNNLIISNNCGLEFVIKNFETSKWKQEQLPTNEISAKSLSYNQVQLVAIQEKQYTLHCGDTDTLDISWSLPESFGKKLWNLLQTKVR